MAEYINWTVMVSHYWLLCLDINLVRCFSTKCRKFWSVWMPSGVMEGRDLRLCVCGSDDKLLRDNHTISSDGEGGQSEDFMNCQYREKEALFGIAHSHTYLTISAVCAGRKLQTALRLMAQRPNLAPCWVLSSHLIWFWWNIGHQSTFCSKLAGEFRSTQKSISDPRAKFGPERGHLSLFLAIVQQSYFPKSEPAPFRLVY